MSDALRAAMRAASHWTQLAWAEAWAAAAAALAPTHPGAARRAWAWAADGYEAYGEEHARNRPASRFDHDYRPEAEAARRRARGDAHDRGAPALPPWIELALAGRLDDAVAVAAPDGAPVARAVARALACACAAAGRRDVALRLDPPPAQ